jgi:hypothetical protein
MKIRELVISSAEFEVRKAVREKLAESINKHLTSAVALFKARDDEDASDKGVNLDQLAQLIAGLKVLSKREHRDVITKDDVGVDPNNAKDLFALLDKIPDKPTAEVAKPQAEVFTALAALAPSLLKKEREELELLVDKDSAKRHAAISKLSSFATKVDQMFNQFHTAATKAAAAQPRPGA